MQLRLAKAFRFRYTDAAKEVLHRETTDPGRGAGTHDVRAGGLNAFYEDKGGRPVSQESAAPESLPVGETVPPEESAPPQPAVQQDFSGLPYVYHAQVPILMYHEVNDAQLNNLYLSVADFQSHLDYFQEAGITPITMEQLWNHWVNEAPLPDKPVVLTFDDGYRSMYTTVYPMLAERGWPGTFYCVSDYTASGDFISEDMIREMAAAGMEIGSHTASHVELDSCAGDALNEQLTQSRDILSGMSEKPRGAVMLSLRALQSGHPGRRPGRGLPLRRDHRIWLRRPEQGLFALKRIRISLGNTGETLRAIFSTLGYG